MRFDVAATAADSACSDAGVLLQLNGAFGSEKYRSAIIMAEP
jgi:hypothetical protein